jgi:LysR family glycine cleavage system transcriptional activator
MPTRRLVPPLSELLAFESAARHASFTRAAADLNLSQAAISRAVRMLEERLGVRLFERVRQRVVLTRPGEAYWREVQPLLQQLDEATRRLATSAAAGATLNLAVLPTFATRWLIPRLPEFLAERPGLTINLATRLAPFDFAGERFDAALHHGHAAWAGATTHLLMRETMIAVCSPAFRTRNAIADEADLAGLPLLHQSTRPEAWANWFEGGGLGLEHAHHGPVLDQFEMIAAAASAGLGAALLPRFLVEQELASARLEILFPRPLQMSSGYFLAIPEEEGGEAVEAFRAWLVARARAEALD